MITFDTETTGLYRPEACELKLQPHLIEFYAAKFDYKGKILKEFETLIKPPVPIPEAITKITGIDDHMVRNAPTFIEIYDDLAEFFLGEKTLFAHNCAFDTNVLTVELKRHGLEYKFPYPPMQCCTVEASFPIANKRLTLDALYKTLLGKEIAKNRHRAKGDVLPTIECVVALKKEGFIHDIFD